MPTPIAPGEPPLDALQRAETLVQDANRRTQQFLATLGHELRNPLSALGNALDHWPRAKDDPARMEELRRIMLRQVRQLTHLSDDLLDVARIAQGKLELRREQVALRELIDHALEEVRPLIDRCGHSLTVRLPAEPIEVYGDPPRLLQVFANLLQNAAKFTDRNGSLCVTVERQEGSALVRVRDNGPGIVPHRLPAIFESLTSGDAARFPANDGLGIGLRLVKTIVELHGGTVAARSDGPGHGSEFSVQLPMTNAAAHVRRRPPSPPTAGHNGDSRRKPAHRIVVVDDDESSAELLARLLRPIALSVSVADSGATAIRTVLEQRPDVVFLDMVLGDMDGCEVDRRLRGHAELSGLVLIALSGNGDEASQRRAREAGFDKFFVKPTSIAVLNEALAGIPTATGACEL